MSRLNILSFSEKKEFDSLRELTGEERELYFRKTNAFNNLLTPITNPSNKMIFALMLYHFKISKKFFHVNMFNLRDIKYISHILGLDYISKECVLENKTFDRYKAQILNTQGTPHLIRRQRSL